MAPATLPALAISSAVPSPTSITGTFRCAVSAGAQATDTARTLNCSGATTLICVASSAQDAGMVNFSVVALSAPTAFKACTPQSTAFCIAGVPGTRPPISSVSRRRLVSSGEDFRASPIRRLLGSCAKAAQSRTAGRRRQIFVFGITAALETKIKKRAKRGTSEVRGPKSDAALLLLIQHPHGFQDHAAHDFQTLGAELVDCVLGSMPEDVVIAIIEINQVDAGHAEMHERSVIVFFPDGSSEEMGLVAQPRGCLINHVFEPGRGVGIAIDVQVGVTDHIGQQECLDLLQRPVVPPFLRQVPCAVEAVGRSPLFHSLFAVRPQQPNAVAVTLLAAEMVRQFKQDR